tara:strand:+ start:132 stop:383 length:252 start_codon:yes stop_codon:yes gene_type:complete
MKKPQVLELILNVAKELLESKVVMNNEEMEVANKINSLGEKGIMSLNEQETEHAISILFLSEKFAIERIDVCIDLLQENKLAE